MRRRVNDTNACRMQSRINHYYGRSGICQAPRASGLAVSRCVYMQVVGIWYCRIVCYLLLISTNRHINFFRNSRTYCGSIGDTVTLQAAHSIFLLIARQLQSVFTFSFIILLPPFALLHPFDMYCVPRVRK